MSDERILMPTGAERGPDEPSGQRAGSRVGELSSASPAPELASTTGDCSSRLQDSELERLRVEAETFLRTAKWWAEKARKAEVRVGVLEGALREAIDLARSTVVTPETLSAIERLAAVLAGGEAAPEPMTKDEYANYIRTGERGSKHLPMPEDHDAAIRECVADGTLDESHLRHIPLVRDTGGEAAADARQIAPIIVREIARLIRTGATEAAAATCDEFLRASGEEAGQGEEET